MISTSETEPILRFIFFCSSIGDTNLAQATIRSLNKKPGHLCTTIALSDTVTDHLTTFADEFNSVTTIVQINEQPIADCSNHDIAEFVRRSNFSHAFVGMPSDSQDERAMQIASALDIPVTFASEFMFEPPSGHRIWRYQEALCQKNNLQFAVPLLSTGLFSEHPRRYAIGHLSLNTVFSNVAISTDEKLATKSQLLVQDTDRLAVVSGTTQNPGVDTEFLTVLLGELPNHPSVQLRYSIHPGVKQNMTEYIKTLIAVAENAGVTQQFKIILNNAIKAKLPPTDLSDLLRSPWIIDTNVSGNAASSAADAVAQAVPGALVNTSAAQGKPTFAHGNKPLLPDSWFSENIVLFFSTAPGTPHQITELGFTKDHTVAEIMAALMLTTSMCS
ncbi:MAG: hypothetical protein NXI01_02220 [Gammaproteobacteria bacterium]|nr:hypothetical protein [Gammaproteobacteria bacterium]